MLRVVSVATGQTLGVVPRASLRAIYPRSPWHGPEIPERTLAVSDAGSVAIVDANGAVRVWQPGLATVEELRAPVTATEWSTPRLARDGRVLFHEVDGRAHVWDLVARRRVPVALGPAERVLALGRDGTRVVVRTPVAIEVREVRDGRVLFTRATRTSAQVRALAAAGSGHVFLAVESALVVVQPDGTSTSQVFSGRLDRVSDDGRWLQVRNAAPPYFEAPKEHATVLEVDADGHVSRAREGVQDPKFHGGYMAWIEWVAGREVVHVETVAEPAERHLLRADKRVAALAFAAGGDEVLMLLEDGRGVRWRWATTDERGERIASAPDQPARAPAGAVWLHEPDPDRIHILANDDSLRRLATLYPLVSGEWLVISRSGAVDGSDRAIDNLVTHVEDDETALVFDGRLGWEGAHVVDTAALALRGVDVVPPALVRE